MTFIFSSPFAPRRQSYYYALLLVLATQCWYFIAQLASWPPQQIFFLVGFLGCLLLLVTTMTLACSLPNDCYQNQQTNNHSIMARNNSNSILDKQTIVQEYTISVLLVDYRINVVDYKINVVDYGINVAYYKTRLL